MSTAEAQSTATESLPQAVPSCEFCGSAIALEPNERDCCHHLTNTFHAMQLDSARNVARHVIYLRKQIEALVARLSALEVKVASLDVPVPGPSPLVAGTSRKAKA